MELELVVDVALYVALGPTKEALEAVRQRHGPRPPPD